MRAFLKGIGRERKPTTSVELEQMSCIGARGSFLEGTSLCPAPLVDTGGPEERGECSGAAGEAERPEGPSRTRP